MDLLLGHTHRDMPTSRYTIPNTTFHNKTVPNSFQVSEAKTVNELNRAW